MTEQPETKSASKYGSLQIEANRLQPIAFQFDSPPTLIYFTCPEGTSLCPRSGFPDFWTAHLWLVPKKWIVELKSLKLYLNSYRNLAIYHEELPHRLLHDLKEAIAPAYLKIAIDYTRRGNIQTDVLLEYQEENYVGPKAPSWKVRYAHR